MAALGILLALFCVVQLPTAYQSQTKFNERIRKAIEMREAKPVPKKSVSTNADAVPLRD